MFERASDSDGEDDGRTTGLQKHVDRRTVLRKSAYTTAAAAGLSTVRPVAGSDDTRELLYGGRPESFGAQDLDRLNGANDTECTEVKLAIGSALTGDTTYADDPAKVICNWCAQINSSAGHTEIDNLEATVTVDNYDEVGWEVNDAHKSLREAPQTAGFEPSFGVSVGYFVNFGLSFSASGTESHIDPDFPDSVSYNFGEVCSTDSLAPMENAGWLAVEVNDPTTGCETTNCELTLDVSADVTYTGSGPGPCGSNDFLTDTLNAHNSFEVEFDPDDC